MMKNKIVRLSEHIHKLGPLGDPKVLSSYLVTDDTKNAVIDCGPNVVIDELVDLICACGIAPDKIDYLLLTHIHIDHAGGASRFLEKCPNCRVFVPRRGFKHLIDPSVLNASARAVLGDELMDYWGECSPLAADRVQPVFEQESVTVGKRLIRYIPAKGHAPHHNVLFEESSGSLFAADSLGIVDLKTGAHTPTTPPPSLDFEQALKDIDVVERLGAKLVCLSHYGEVRTSDAFFSSARSIYETWGRIVKDYVSRRGLIEYDLPDYYAIFSELESIFPEYAMIPRSLKDQITRVDVGGLVNYFRAIALRS
ncbi:MAG: MBL fold metallo-hydrolase [Nitrososphaerales archaeon]